MILSVDFIRNVLWHFSARRGLKHPTEWLQFAQGDHPSNSKRVGVFVFYKGTLGVSIVKSLKFSECIICKVSIQNSKGYVGVVYRSPSQDSFEFETFCQILRKL